MTSSGPETRKSGEPITGIAKFSCKIFGSGMMILFLKKASLT
jgi:hypothetical protein